MRVETIGNVADFDPGWQHDHEASPASLGTEYHDRISADCHEGIDRLALSTGLVTGKAPRVRGPMTIDSEGGQPIG